jgi:hypothetical protein
MEDAAHQKLAFSRFATTEASADAVPLRTLGAPMKSVTFPDLNTTRLTEPMLEYEVGLRAYERYQRRRKVDGHALEDWLQAEADVRQRLSQDLLSLTA